MNNSNLNSDLQKGDKVTVISGSEDFHFFPLGSVVEYVGKDVFLGLVRCSRNGTREDTQYLEPQHYRKLNVATTGQENDEPDDSNQPSLPRKVVYAVLDSDDIVYATTSDRDYAREIKAGLGGKVSGVKIYQYAAIKEIR